MLNNCYVGGTWVEPQSDRKLELISPMTAECFVKVPEASNADVDRAVRAAREALPSVLSSTGLMTGKPARTEFL